MTSDSNRREFLKRAGLLAVAAPGAAAVLDACGSVVASAKASTIRVGWAIEPDTMNPLTTYSTEAVEVLQLVYDNLIHYDLALDPVSAYYTVSSMIELLFTRQLYQYRDLTNFAQQIKPVPDVATGYPVLTDGGKTYTIHIKSGVMWDTTPPRRWIPDWFGNNGRATIVPLFTDPGLLANDFDGYNSPVTNALISKALTSPTQAQAASYWAKANQQVVKDVADVPLIFQRWAVYHSARVHGCTFFVYALNCDPANVWLSG